MIEEFSFGNFLSFKDIQTLNMAAAKIKSNNPVLDTDNIIPIRDNLSLLKSKAIYGANASGKSNIAKALNAFALIIGNSVKDEKVLQHFVYSFQLSEETLSKPSFFQLIFRMGDIRYRYGFEADHQSIKSEWLYSTINKREQPLFIRENDAILEINKTHFDEGQKAISLMSDGDGQIYRNNSLFLSSLATFGFGKLSQAIVNEITSIVFISGLGHSRLYENALDALNYSYMKDFILNLLQKADVGIQDLNTIERKANENNGEKIVLDPPHASYKLLISQRKVFDKDLKENGEIQSIFDVCESEGTKKMFELSPLLYHTLKEGGTIFIDEFDARFHPLLTKKIVELFNSNTNTKAQLIFITHDTNLLSSELMRRDQIDFVEKDKYGASHLYSLVEIKGVRNDASFEKDYIQGKYGAIPFLGDFSNLLKFE